jgi:hypothetical protein
LSWVAISIDINFQFLSVSSLIQAISAVSHRRKFSRINILDPVSACGSQLLVDTLRILP